MAQPPSHPIPNKAADRSTAIASQVIEAVRDLALELHPRLRARLDVRLDSNLDRDLGFDSLGRAELLLRLDRIFKIHLPDQLIGDAETPQDLLRAILAAEPARMPTAVRTPIGKVALPDVTEPVAASTLIEALAHHVRRHGERPHIALWSSDEVEQTITYAELERGARAVAAGLLRGGLQQGERVALMLPTEADFFAGFFGVLYAGGVPVPIYPPFRRSQVEDHLRRQAGILRNAEACLLITNQEIRNVGQILYGLAGSLRRIELISELRQSETMSEPLPADADTIALIQYTSGSTGDPKGVVLSHANLLANIRAMGDVMEASASDVFVSWLPLYHDMGLIGAWLGCLYYGAQAVIMPPFAFLADPARWLWTIHHHRATLSAAPNFAFELCLKAMRDEDVSGLDLSSWRMAVNGAEPVSPSTIARFTDKFARFGFRPESMAPVYGLAECSVGLAFPPLGRKPLIDRVQRAILENRGLAEPAQPEDRNALEFVACGHPLPGHEIRIVDEQGLELPERREGRLQFKGPSATKGYFRNEEKTRALFDGEWLESGDRAYVAAGDIFITGRVKDIIIRAGRNIYPHELEECVGEIEGVRKGCVAVFASPDPRTATERLIVLAETRLTEPSELQRLRDRISDVSLAVLDLPPDEIILAPPRTVPKTSSGKIRRSHARALFESDALLQKPRALWWQLGRLTMASFANRLRRSARRSGALAYAAWWWSALVLIAIALWPLVIALPCRAWRHAAVGKAARLFLWLTGIRLDVMREAPVPNAGAVIVVNHSSYLDGAVVSALISGPLAFMAKEELATQIVAGPFLRRLGTVFIRRTDARGGVEDTAATLAAAQAGERIVAFPEGTLTRMPGLREFRLGAFIVAAQAGIPVVPIAIRGTRSILRGEQWFPRHGGVYAHIGKPLAADGHDFNAALRLRDRTRSAILAACGEPDLAPA